MDAAINSSVDKLFKVKKADMRKYSTPVATERARSQRSAAPENTFSRIYRFTPEQGECYSCGAPIDGGIMAMQPAFLCRAHFVSYCQQCSRSAT